MSLKILTLRVLLSFTSPMSALPAVPKQITFRPPISSSKSLVESTAHNQDLKMT
ncbi:uncharacterized protein RAG0_08457 [Rhynchosporium agropyri]|uniref:Uncharacterized protein n=1 Tax=Rhynchosporium agropyri TaxID=914238 RepID=A0A1E1KQY9_9HELO|nr:uncharacterized protein RAG0_08457 [Rhynchosporium agropyri]